LSLVNNNLHGGIDLTVLTKLHDTNLSNNKITNIKDQGIEELVAITANNNNLKNIKVNENNKTQYTLTENNKDKEHSKITITYELLDLRLSNMGLEKID